MHSQNKFFRIFGLCVFVLALCIAENGNAQVRLRVMTYNIRWGERADIATLSKVVRKYNPDLVALQEVDINVRHWKKTAANHVHQVSQFAQHTGMHALFGGAFHVKRYPFGFGGGEFGNAILSKYSFDYTEKHTYAAKGTEPRIGLEAVITLPNEEKIRFISTHLDHNNDSIRRMQIDEINRIFPIDDIPTLLCGDFNEGPDAPNGCIARMDTQWTRACDPDTPTFIAWNPTVKLDYVFFRPHARWRVVSREVADEQNASDHRPLLVVLELME